jgi:hypothetical protein
METVGRSSCRDAFHPAETSLAEFNPKFLRNGWGWLLVDVG